jgi:hypothetical protein
MAAVASASNRRFVRFSLRSLLAIVAVVAGAFGWLSWRFEKAREQAFAVAELQKIGCRIS